MKNEQNPPILKEFMNYLRVSRNRSPRTVSAYAQDLRLFFRYVLLSRDGVSPDAEAMEAVDLDRFDRKIAGDVLPEDVYAFMEYTADDRENVARTRARKLSAVKAFYKYYVNVARTLDNNPAEHIDTPTVRPALPKFLTLEESRTLLDTVRSDTESPARLRDFAILTLFLNCGMRLSELTGINLQDIDPSLRSLRVTGKGAKQRIVYLNDACREAIGEYLTERRAVSDVHPGDRSALFLSRQRRRISNPTVQKMVYRYLDEAGLGNRSLSVHKLRHTAATLMYQTGAVDVRVLKDILGHEQLNTTQIYTHVSNTQMEQAMQANPLAVEAPVKHHTSE